MFTCGKIWQQWTGLQMRQRTTALGRLAAWLEQQKSGLKVGDNISEVLMMKYFDDVHEPACRKAATVNSKSDGTRTSHGVWDALSFLEKNWGLAFNATVCKAAGGDGYNQSFFVGILWQCVRSYARTVGRRRCLPQRGSAHMGAPTSSGSTGGARSSLRGRQGGELWGRRGRWPSEYTYLKYYTPCRQQAECLWKPDAVARACAARLRKMPERYARLQLTVDTIKCSVGTSWQCVSSYERMVGRSGCLLMNVSARMGCLTTSGSTG